MDRLAINDCSTSGNATTDDAAFAKGRYHWDGSKVGGGAE